MREGGKQVGKESEENERRWKLRRNTRIDQEREEGGNGSRSSASGDGCAHCIIWDLQNATPSA